MTPPSETRATKSTKEDLMAPTDTSDLRIAYSDSASGEPVLLLHCSSASGAEWDSLCAVLGGVFRTIVPDQWGCGNSPAWTGRSTFTLAQEAAPVLDILDTLGEPVHLVGHSYGGGVALHIARTRPDRVKSLTLIEPSCFHILRDGDSENGELFREIAGVADGVKAAVASGDYWGGMEAFVDYWNGTGAWAEMHHKAKMTLSQRLGKVVLDFHALFEEPARLADYARLTMPALILCGERSPGPSKKIVAMLASALRQARVERIPGAGHMSPFTHADAVNRHVHGYLGFAAEKTAIAA